MKTYFQLKEELVQLSELKSSSRSHDILKTGIGTKVGHNGHEGGAIYHNSMADEHKGTAAGKLHAKAADHHSNAVSALNKGNISSAFQHSKLAAQSAKKARMAGGSKSDSETLHNHHTSIHKGHQRAMATANSAAARKTKAKTDKPIQRAIGKAKSKISGFRSKVSI